MECLEDGELPSSPEEPAQNIEGGIPIQPVYTPLPRPQIAQSSNSISDEERDTFPRVATNMKSNEDISSSMMYSISEQTAISRGYQVSSSGSESSEDSDSDSPYSKNTSGRKSRGKKFRRYGIQAANKLCSNKPNDGGADFQNAVKEYHDNKYTNKGILSTTCDGDKRKGTGKNNVWGSILNEDALTSDLTSIAVGRKSVKDLNSDRGAEVVIINEFIV